MHQRFVNPRVVIPNPQRVRRIGRYGFGWLDARLHRRGWLQLLSPQALSVYTFLCLTANSHGVSWYRKDRLADALGLSVSSVQQSLKRLIQLELVAYQPFHRHASDGFFQVLELVEDDPPAFEDLLVGPDDWGQP